MRVIVFNAQKKGVIEERARSNSDAVIMHIMYLTYLNADQGLIDYWTKELASKLSAILSKPKGGKFTYTWYFEPNLVFDEDDVEIYLSNVDDSHEKLVPNKVDGSIGVSNVYDLMSKLIEESKGKILPKDKIIEIIKSVIKHEGSN